MGIPHLPGKQGKPPNERYKWKLIQVKVNNTKGLGKKTNPVEN